MQRAMPPTSRDEAVANRRRDPADVGGRAARRTISDDMYLSSSSTVAETTISIEDVTTARHVNYEVSGYGSADEEGDTTITMGRSQSFVTMSEPILRSYDDDFSFGPPTLPTPSLDIVVERDPMPAFTQSPEQPFFDAILARERGSAESRGDDMYTPRERNDRLWNVDGRREVSVPAGLVDRARGWETDTDEDDTEWETDKETGKKRKKQKKGGQPRTMRVSMPDSGNATIRVPAGVEVRVESSSLATSLLLESEVVPKRRNRRTKARRSRSDAEYWSAGVK